MKIGWVIKLWNSILNKLSWTLICLSDAGFPVPDKIKKIDISLNDNIPRLIDVLKVLIENLFVEKIILTEEMRNNCPEMFRDVINLFDVIEVELLDHMEFKKMVKMTKGFIRTGEFTAFSNIMLVAGANPERWVYK